MCTRGQNFWVRGYANKTDIERGRTIWEHKTRKHGADEIAVQGASSHKVLVEVVAHAKVRRVNSLH